MFYHRLGPTGLEISRVILGCGNFGGIGSAPAFYGRGETQPQANALLDRAWNAGVTVFDTADAYGGGRSERWIGDWIAGKGSAVRDRLVLTTKVFNPVGPGPNDRGLSRRHILTQIDASLARLRTDWIDLYLLHEPDPATPIEETLRAMDDLMRVGKVRQVGASNFEAWRLASAIAASDALGLVRCACLQNGYSLLDRSVEREVLPYCDDAGVGFTAFSPLAGGWLTGKYRADATYPAGSRMTMRPEPYRHLEDAAVFASIAALAARAAARGTSMPVLAMAWVLHQPRVDAVVVGPRTAEQLDQAIAAVDVRLTDDESAALAGLFPAGS